MMCGFGRFGSATLAAAALLMLAPVAAAQPKCSSTTCGVVQNVQQVAQKGNASGVGLVGGAVLGGVLGHQIGSGRGNTAATIIGAGAGAYAGNEVEKNVKKTYSWNVAIRMDNGATRYLSFSNPPQVHPGERVRLIDGGRRLALVSG